MRIRRDPRAFSSPGVRVIRSYGSVAVLPQKTKGCDGHQVGKGNTAQSINQLLGNHS